MTLSAQNIVEAIGATPSSGIDFPVKVLLTDSRDLTYPAETAFFALRTSGNDGHNYIPELYRRGVRMFVTDRDIEGNYPDALICRVDDVLSALQRLGKRARDMHLTVPVIAITGSRGKTVVKEMLYQLLCPAMRVSRSPRSYNSQIGVPLSAWEISPDAEIAIFEAGISRCGEMDQLREIISPTIGVFTQLTNEHSDGFASIEEKMAEKARLFRDCEHIYYLAGDEIVAEAIAKAAPNARLHPVEGGNEDLARAVARVFGDTWSSVPAKLHTVSPKISVGEALKNCLIVYDGFTNDLRSVYDALNFMNRRSTPGRTSTLILGDITPADNDYEALARLIDAKGIKRFIAVGTTLKAHADSFAGQSYSVEFVDSADDFVKTYTISDFADELILVKGAPGSGFEEVKSHLEAPRHETILEVDLGAITNNFNYFRSKLKPTTGIVAMVKAAGYGVGSLELAKTLQTQGAAYLAVAVIDEGVELRRAGITMPIIVMNPIGTNYKALFDNHLEPSVFSIRELNLLLDNAQRLGVKDYPVHIKLDTGMHRLGFLESELDSLIERLSQQDNVMVSSVFSHLATADCLDEDEYTEGQLSAFARMSGKLKSQIPYPIKRHILNTAGILRYPEHQYDMVRLGIGLYGVSPIPLPQSESTKLQTVASLVTTIISIKEWDDGTTIGYSRRGRVTHPSVIATIPIGYADGLDRHLSNGAMKVMVNGKECPVIGNICMDQCMIDVTGAGASIGDTVEIFGKEAPVERLSDTLQTIPYEILTSVSPRVKRIYFRE